MLQLIVDDLKSKLIILERRGSDSDGENTADEKPDDDDEEGCNVLKILKKYL